LFGVSVFDADDVEFGAEEGEEMHDFLGGRGGCGGEEG